MRSEMKLLFNEYDLSNVLSSHSIKAKQYISRLDRIKLLEADSETLLARLKTEFCVNTIELQEQNISVSQKESKIDVSRDTERVIESRIFL